MIVSLFENLEYAPETSRNLIDTEAINTESVPDALKDELTELEKQKFLEDRKEAKRLLEESTDNFGWGYSYDDYPKFIGNEEIEGNLRFIDIVDHASTSYPANVEKSLTLYQA